ncbi:hypothetical protein D3C85_465830 [compost metagenome]
MQTEKLIKMVPSLKSNVAHNVAQNLLANENFDIYGYLGECAMVFFNVGIPDDYVHDIYLYALHHGPEEVEVVKGMYARHGISMNVEGNSGSAIAPSIMLEIAIVQALA